MCGFLRFGEADRGAKGKNNILTGLHLCTHSMSFAWKRENSLN